jgi:hypothetical protein
MTTTPELDEEELAMELAFNRHTSESANEPESAKAEPEAPTSAAPATADKPAVDQPAETTAPAEDPFASLPPAVRDLLARVPALEARLEAATRMANMVPALQSRLDKLNQPAAIEPSSVPAGRKYAKVEALRNELPEIADALDEIVADRHREPDPQATPQQHAPDANPHEEALTSVRPTWADDLTSSGFQLWLSQQPRDYQAAVVSTNKAGDILAALGQYDAFAARTQSTQQLNQNRATRMAAAVAPQGDGRRQRVQAAPEDEEEAAMAAAFKAARGRQ